MNVSASFDSFNISLGGSPGLLLAGFILLVAIILFVYRFTVPRISPVLKSVLVTLRILALLSILALILEPLITINYKKEIYPVNLLFIDNSKSMVLEDSSQKAAEIRSLMADFINRNPEGVEIYSFGSSIQKINPDSLEQIAFTDINTNYSLLFNYLKNANKYISSSTIVSDGIITEGSDPLYEQIGDTYPLYTIGVGDTSVERDAEIRKVINNEFIYVNQNTDINVTILSNGYEGQNVPVSLMANNTLVEQQLINIDRSGINVVNFSFTPKTAGQTKLTIRLGALKDERTYSNNVYNFFIDVLSDKLKIALLAGSPSNDVSFLYNSIVANENLQIARFIQINRESMYTDENERNFLDSADVLFLINFPGINTQADFFNNVVEKIKSRHIPFFISVAEGTDLRRLSVLRNELPFDITRIQAGSSEIQMAIHDLTHPFFKFGSSDDASAWDNFPPIIQTNSLFQPSPGSEVLAKIKKKNIPLDSPLILTRSVGLNRAVALLGGEYWKWKLLNADKNYRYYDNFFAALIKWLRIETEKNPVNIRVVKNVLAIGEQIEFSGQIYDETFNPVDNADVTLTVRSENDSYNITMSSIGRGLYEGILESGKPGDYSYTGSANLGNKLLGTDRGRFTVQDTDNESLQTTMNKKLLLQLAEFSGGVYKYIDSWREISSLPEYGNRNKPKVELSSYEIQLRDNEIPLILIIVLFALEWFLRKRNGML